MKYVYFKTASIQNFLSIGNDPVIVNFAPGLHIITGENKDKSERRNGVGKSTILDGVYFGIFGETIREIPNDKIVNNVTKKGSYIELTFDIKDNGLTKSYKIIRTLAPSKCYLYEDEVDITHSSIAKTTEAIKDLLGTTPEVFRNSVAMTVNESVPFMAQKGVLKRKFIEGIMNLSVFSDMLQHSRGEYNESKKDYDVEAGKLPILKNTISTLEEQSKNWEIKKCEKISQLRERISKIDGQIETLTKSIIKPDEKRQEDIERLISICQDKVDGIDLEIEAGAEKMGSVLATHKSIKDSIERLSNSPGAECTHCMRPFSEHDAIQRKMILENLTTQLSESAGVIQSEKQYLLSLKDAKANASADLTMHRELLKQEMTLKEQYRRQCNMLEQLAEDRNRTEKEIQDLDKQTPESANALEACKINAKAVESKLDDIRENLTVLDSVKFVLSEEGVKSHITKKILQLLNSKIGYYLQKMDANCTITFDEYFAEKIVNDMGEECAYFNFSGAERKSIDLACLFAFMDIRRLQGNLYLNISAYDELLDSSLDTKGLELVIDILKERVEKYQEGCYIISHRKEATKQATGEVIYLEKHNRITKRVPYNA